MTDQAILSLEKLISLIPAHIYWKDKTGVYVSCNRKQAQSLGCEAPEDIIGKTDLELPWLKEDAQRFRDNDLEVMSSQKTKILEETAIVDGSEAVVLSQKTPLFNSRGEITGVLGISIDITERKRMEERARMAAEEATRLRVENAVNKTQLNSQKEMSKAANQVAHDIRSPLSSLLMVIKNCKDIPEGERIALREAARSIGDIANHLVSRYKLDESELSVYKEERVAVLLSPTLLQLITDKTYQYKNLPISFDDKFSELSQFAFIKVELSSFKRMLSNLINNAVDAFEMKSGKITIKLDVISEKVIITIVDNGKGMPPEMIDKIMQNVVFTEKVGGHGIGLTQIRETLARNEGKMLIDSKVGQGTKISLVFPRIETPDWIAKEIQLGSSDTVIILDDDISIHQAWDRRFASILENYPNIKVRHFENCHDAVRFIDDFSHEEKEKIYLLTDYELLKQELNGLHVIEKAKIKRSILVTSHYADAIVFERATKLHTQILPKQLAAEIPIHIDAFVSPRPQVTEYKSLKSVDLVLVDDDNAFATSLMRFIFKDNVVHHYEDPQKFIENLSCYPKDTRMYLDHNFAASGLTGVEIAATLHEQGFTHIYLLSGETFTLNVLPDYLKVIRKDDVDNIKDW